MNLLEVLEEFLLDHPILPAGAPQCDVFQWMESYIGYLTERGEAAFEGVPVYRRRHVRNFAWAEFAVRPRYWLERVGGEFGSRLLEWVEWQYPSNQLAPLVAFIREPYTQEILFSTSWLVDGPTDEPRDMAMVYRMYWVRRFWGDTLPDPIEEFAREIEALTASSERDETFIIEEDDDCAVQPVNDQ